MGDIGDYWREHKEYVKNKGKSKSKPEVYYKCSCGKKYYRSSDDYKIKAHMNAKGEGHTLVKGEFFNYGGEL